MNPVRGIETRQYSKNTPHTITCFLFMNPVRGIETSCERISSGALPAFLIYESRSRD